MIVRKNENVCENRNVGLIADIGIQLDLVFPRMTQSSICFSRVISYVNLEAKVLDKEKLCINILIYFIIIHLRKIRYALHVVT